MHTTSEVVHLCANLSPTQALAFLPVFVSLAVNNILFVVVDVLATLQPYMHACSAATCAHLPEATAAAMLSYVSQVLARLQRPGSFRRLTYIKASNVRFTLYMHTCDVHAYV